MTSAITLWHGSHRWSGSPSVQRCVKGRYECGPGIYLTNRYETARKYAKGGGSLIEVSLDPSLKWLSSVQISVDEMKSFVRSRSRMLNKATLLSDLDWSANRHGKDVLPADYLVNLCVNNETLSGDHGPALAEWLVEHGADASLHQPKTGESWVIVFNPKIIIRSRKVSASDVTLQSRDFPVLEKR